MTTAAGEPTLRAATTDDVEAIAAVWHSAWRDGHLGHVPDALLPHPTEIPGGTLQVPCRRCEKRP